MLFHSPLVPKLTKKGKQLRKYMLAVVNALPVFWGFRNTLSCLKKALPSGSTDPFHNR